MARVLSVSRAKAYSLIERREIASVRIGRSVRVEPTELREYIDRQRQAAE